MFYAQFLLSKKAPLGVVWKAGHSVKRLRRDQLQNTDISAAVEKILGDEFREMAHRILAFLLLGVVRIFSKKVEYLFECSQELVKRLCSFEIGKADERAVPAKPRNSVGVPCRFSLDSCDVERQEFCGKNKRLRQEMLADGISTRDAVSKEKMLISEPQFTTATPPRDVLSPWRMGIHPVSTSSSNVSYKAAEQMTEIDDKQDNTSARKFVELSRAGFFDLDDRLDPLILTEAENAVLNSRTCKENDNPLPGMDQPRNDIDDGMQKSKPIDHENSECQNSVAHQGVVTQSLREHAMHHRKRKIVWDSTVVVSNNAYRRWLDDTSNIKRRRDRAQKVMQAWNNNSILDLLIIPIPDVEPEVSKFVGKSPSPPTSPVDPISSHNAQSGMEDPISCCFSLRSVIEKMMERDDALAVALSEFTQGKNRNACAKMVYDVLDWSSRGLIRVVQEHPYADILLVKVP